MQEEILEQYEKIKDQLSQKEFLEEIEKVKSDNEGVNFIDDFGAAQIVVQNYIGVDTSILSKSDDESQQEAPFNPLGADEIESDMNEKSTENESVAFEMNDEIQEKYNKVKDKISEEEFLNRMMEFKEQDPENPFMNASAFADMVVGELIDEEVESILDKPEFSSKTISELEEGSRDVIISGRVISISNPRSFKTRKGGKGEVCNVELQDISGKMRTVFWTQNMPLLKRFNEGDIIQIKNVDIKDGYSGL